MLRRKSSKKDASSVVSERTGKLRRSRSRSAIRVISKKGKSLRGFITGSSRRKKKQEKERKARAASTLAAIEERTVKPQEVNLPQDDQSTVFGIEFDPNSNSKDLKSEELTEQMENALEGDPLEIVLLLMDAETRRFELLQLEFDSNRALVRDIIAQIPDSVTEESLRHKTYTSICDSKGNVMANDNRLSEYCSGIDIVIAMTDSIDSDECIRSAKPILMEPKVAEIVSHYFQINFIFPHIFLIYGFLRIFPFLVYSCLLFLQLLASGINITNNEETSQPPDEPTEIEENTHNVIEDFTNDSKVDQSAIDTEENEDKKSKKSITIVVVLTGVVMAMIASFAAVAQKTLTSPLQRGDVLAPGQWRSQCGLLTLLHLEYCQSPLIKMGNDGVLNLYDENGTIFALTGPLCEEGSECISGLVIGEDGTVTIGGVAPTVSKKSKIPLNPWPFSEGIEYSSGKGSWY